MALNPQLRKMAGQVASKYKGNAENASKPKDGRNTYRLLWPTKAQAPWMTTDVASGVDMFWHDLGVHWIKAEENAKPSVVIGDCEVVYDKPSLINAAIDAAIASAYDEEAKKLYTGWKARRTVLLNVIDRSNDQVVVLELTRTTFGKIMDLIQMYADNDQDITDAKTGMDIVITKSGRMLSTEYDVAVAPGVSKPVKPEVFSQLTDLKQFIEGNFFRGEEQKALNIISQIAGVAVPRLGAPTPNVSTSTAALTSSAASVAPQPEVAEVKTSVATPPQTSPEDARKAELMRKQQELAAQMAALDAEVAASPASSDPVSETDTSEGGLSNDESEAILAELDNLS